MHNKREINGHIFINVLGRIGRASRLLQAVARMKCHQGTLLKMTD
jgi:hypothetical protein